MFRVWKHFVSPVKQGVSAAETNCFAVLCGSETNGVSVNVPVLICLLQQLIVFVDAADGTQAGAFGKMDGCVGLIALHTAAGKEDRGIVANGDVVPRCVESRQDMVGTREGFDVRE